MARYGAGRSLIRGPLLQGRRYQPSAASCGYVTISLNGQPYDAGRRIADELYLEMARRERA